jgi:hypothetical protein
MNTPARTALRRLLTILSIALLAAGAGACDSEDTARQRQETEGAESNPTRGGGGVVSADPTEAPAAVNVMLKEYEVRMPTILKPGSHLFKVKNDGTEPHGLTVEGNGTTVSLPTNARPGETESLPVDLAPGTYRVFCPVDGHADRGMSVEITVSE